MGCGSRAPHISPSGSPGIYAPGGGGGLLAASLYQPHIQTHASITREGYNMRRDSIVMPAFSDLLFQSVLRPAQIHRMSLRTVRWSPSWRAVTLASTDAQVSSKIQDRLTNSLRRGLGIWVLSFENNLSSADASSRRMSRRGKRRALRRHPVSSYASSPLRDPRTI